MTHPPFSSSCKPYASLIVVTYNSAATLPAFFTALAAAGDRDVEVIVVDNASRDGTAALARRLWPGARVIASADNLGFGRACNLGARAARGDLLIFLNPDVYVTPGWLATLARHLAERPDAAIICPQTWEPGAIDQGLGARDQGDTGAGRQGDGAISPQPLATSPQPPTAAVTPPVEESAAVPGCAMMISRRAWEALGGFDEQIFLYWEDIELCWRAWLLGWCVLSDLEAAVVHERGGSGGGGGWDAERAKNSLYTYLKLMRWRRVVPFATRLALVSLAKAATGRGRGLGAAWAWNWRNLGGTLARRREIARRRRGDPAALERLAAAHERRQRRERRERDRVTR
jgi:GT2 family glycosyltransferase